MLWDHILEKIRGQDQKRAERLRRVKTPAQLRDLQRYVRSSLLEMWGPLPEERSPLNPRQMGTLDRGDHAIEKVIFESRPRFHVTANLYRPKEPGGRLPAIVFPPGHGSAGKAYEAYQRFCILMARNGFAVLALDCIGQGERLQLWDASTRSSPVRPGTGEHTVLGRQCYLLGINLMQYRVWDTIRGLDYLLSRDDVDPERIGLAGQSGGGMEALQLAPFETRFKAAVSVCAVATFRHKTEALLMADPEQILVGTLERGIDHPELLATIAPRPVLIGSAIRDYVPIAAARATYAEVRPVFDAIDAQDKVRMIETDDTHGLNAEFRRGLCEWFSRWLGASPPAVAEEHVDLPDERELQCTRSGQVVEEFGGETVFTMNRRLCDGAAGGPALPKSPSRFPGYRSKMKTVVEQITRLGLMKPDGGVEVPVKVFGDKGDIALLVAEAGKDDAAVQRDIIQPVVAAGHRVAGMDVRGWGETKPRMEGKGANFAWDDFFAYRSLELGQPLFGQRLRDVLVAAPRVPAAGPWTAIGVGAGALLLAHAAVVEPRFHRVVLIRPLLSYRSLVADPLYRQPFSLFLPGVISAYDVADLLACIAPRKVLILNPEDAQRRPVTMSVAAGELQRASHAHQLARSAGFEVKCGLSADAIGHEIARWMAA
jgi:cephalosporin-C deacetylase-like acetyl esterase